MARMAIVTDYDFVRSGDSWYARIPWDHDFASLYGPVIEEILLVGVLRSPEGLDLAMWHRVGMSFEVAALPPFSLFPWKMWARARLLLDIIRLSDIVMLKMFYPTSVMAYFIARYVKRRPLVAVLVGDPEQAFKLRRDIIPWKFLRAVVARFVGWLTRKVANGSHRACFVSQGLKRKYWDGQRNCVVANESWLRPADYLPDRRFSSPPASLLYVGRLSEPKGTLLLLEAFKVLVTELPYVRLTIAGDGPLRVSVLNACAADPAIRYQGWIKGQSPELYGLFRSHDVLVLPSMNEGLPLVLLEAMANRTVVCAANVGGVGEIVEDGRSGFLYDNLTVEGLVDALRRVLLSDPKTLQAVTDAAFEVALENSYAKQRGALSQTVKELLSEETSGAPRRVRHRG